MNHSPAECNLDKDDSDRWWRDVELYMSQIVQISDEKLASGNTTNAESINSKLTIPLL